MDISFSEKSIPELKNVHMSSKYFFLVCIYFPICFILFYFGLLGYVLIC